jgi:hypothetical protein
VIYRDIAEKGPDGESFALHLAYRDQCENISLKAKQPAPEVGGAADAIIEYSYQIIIVMDIVKLLARGLRP